MLKNNIVFKIYGGLGDILRVCPLLETMGPITVQIPYYEERSIAWYKSRTDIFELLKILLPQVHFKYIGSKYFDYLEPKYYNILQDWYKLTDRKTCQGKLHLSWDAINKITPFESKEPYIVIHPMSTGRDRRYQYFADVDLSGINYKIVGYPGENGGIPGEVISGTFIELAGLLRGSMGLLCVDSSVMHLANILNVPSIAIYHHDYFCRFAPNHGIGLAEPSPKEVSKHALALYQGLYENYSNDIFGKINYCRGKIL